VTLLNIDDAIWGTSRLVRGIIEGRKRELPHARMVLDCQGRVGKVWRLPEQASVLMLLDAVGQVRFVQVGSTPAERIPALLSAVDALDLPALSAVGVH
jgi:predicted transcriptional regulator